MPSVLFCSMRQWAKPLRLCPYSTWQTQRDGTCGVAGACPSVPSTSIVGQIAPHLLITSTLWLLGAAYDLRFQSSNYSSHIVESRTRQPSSQCNLGSLSRTYEHALSATEPSLRSIEIPTVDNMSSEQRLGAQDHQAHSPRGCDCIYTERSCQPMPCLLMSHE
jgi:hypothetical protein